MTACRARWRLAVDDSAFGLLCKTIAAAACFPAACMAKTVSSITVQRLQPAVCTSTSPLGPIKTSQHTHVMYELRVAYISTDCIHQSHPGHHRQDTVALSVLVLSVSNYVLPHHYSMFVLPDVSYALHCKLHTRQQAHNPPQHSYPCTLCLHLFVTGLEFEKRILASEANNVKFNFLNPTDPYHAYYRMRVRTVVGFGQGRIQG